MLAASLAATAELARSRGTATVADLASAAGISLRTFHRYFPRKEDCVRPALKDARDILIAVIESSPREKPLVDAFLDGFAVAAGGAFSARTAGLIPVVYADPALTAVWDHELHEGIVALTGAVADRLGLSPSEPAASSSAAVLIAMTHLAFTQLAEQGGDVVDHLRARLASLSALPLFSHTNAN